MCDVAIIGAGEIGGALANRLARRSAAASIELIDDDGRVAEGKALDIAQAAPLEGFASEISGSSDLIAASSATVIVIADRANGSARNGEEGLTLLARLVPSSSRAVIVCAGASDRELIERGARELHIPRTRIFGSAPEALAAGARALVALDADASPSDITLSVLGVPPSQIVLSWEHATIAGFALTRLVDEPSRRRIGTRIAALWPPGPYALATAATKVIETLLGRSRRLACCFVAPDDSCGMRTRTAALPVRLGPAGITEVVVPALNVVERVALENAMML